MTPIAALSPAETGLEDAGVAAVAVLVARAENVEEPGLLVTNLGDRVAAQFSRHTLGEVTSFSTIGLGPSPWAGW